MKTRTVISLWIAAILLGVISYFIKFHGKDEVETRTTLAPGDKIFESLPIKNVASVTLTQGEDSTTLDRFGEQTWGVAERGNYTINYEKLRNLLGALNQLEVIQGYPCEPANYARFGLVEKSDKVNERALHILIKAEDGSAIADLYLGKYSGTSRAAGRFLRTATDESGVYAVGETFPGISASPTDWLGQDFLKIEKIKSISVMAPHDDQFKAWTLTRDSENGQYQLKGMTEFEIMQLTSTSPMRNLFGYAAFQDILTEGKAKELQDSNIKLVREATIKTFDGFTYTLTFGPLTPTPKDPDADPRLPDLQPAYTLEISVEGNFEKASAEEKKSLEQKLALAKQLEGRIYQVSQSTVAPLQKKRSDFVKMKPATATTPAVPFPNTPPAPQR